MPEMKELPCKACGTPTMVNRNAHWVLCPEHRKERYCYQLKEFRQRKAMNPDLEPEDYEPVKVRLDKMFPKVTIPTIKDFPELARVMRKAANNEVVV